MVARTITVPNVRRNFIPDEDYFIVEGDLKQADAQVVAWDADAPKLKAVFRAKKDLHTENAITIFGKCTPSLRQRCKAGVHAVNYGVKSRTLAATLETQLLDAQHFIDKWFEENPEIKQWHMDREEELMLTRQVRNIWGYRKYFFSRIDQALTQALGWIGQSTVATAVDHAFLNIDANLPQVQTLLQDHDSLVMQAPKSEFPSILKKIRKQMEVLIPYDDPLVIPVDIKYSFVSWGDCVEYKNEEEKQ